MSGTPHHSTGHGATTPSYHELLCPHMPDSEASPLRIPSCTNLQVLAPPRITQPGMHTELPPFLPLAPGNVTPHHHLSPSSAIQVTPRTTNHQNGVSSERRIWDHSPLYGQGFHACFDTGMMRLLADSPIRLPSSIAHAQPTAQQRSCCATFARLSLNNGYSGVDKGDSGWRITS